MGNTENDNKAAGAPSALNVELERIKSVIDRVLWTAGATEWNKRLLAEAIAEELGDVVAEEREACAKVCEETNEGFKREVSGRLKYPTPEDCARAIRARSNAKNQGDSGGFIAGGSPGLPG